MKSAAAILSSFESYLSPIYQKHLTFYWELNIATVKKGLLNFIVSNIWINFKSKIWTNDLFCFLNVILKPFGFCLLSTIFSPSAPSGFARPPIMIVPPRVQGGIISREKTLIYNQVTFPFFKNRESLMKHSKIF